MSHISIKVNTCNKANESITWFVNCVYYMFTTCGSFIIGINLLDTKDTRAFKYVNKGAFRRSHFDM